MPLSRFDPSILTQETGTPLGEERLACWYLANPQALQNRARFLWPWQKPKDVPVKVEHAPNVFELPKRRKAAR